MHHENGEYQWWQYFCNSLGTMPAMSSGDSNPTGGTNYKLHHKGDGDEDGKLRSSESKHARTRFTMLVLLSENAKDDMILCITCSASSSCTTPGPSNSTSMNTIVCMCGLCALRLHRDHKIVMKTELASDEERTQASDIVNAAVNSIHHRIENVQFDISIAHTEVKKIITREFANFKALLIEISDVKTTPLKVDLEQRMALVETKSQRFHEAFCIFCRAKDEIAEKLKETLKQMERVLYDLNDDESSPRSVNQFTWVSPSSKSRHTPHIMNAPRRRRPQK